MQPKVIVEGFLNGFLEKVAEGFPALTAQQLSTLILAISQNPNLSREHRNELMALAETQQLNPVPGAGILAALLGSAGALGTHLVLRNSNLPMAGHAPLVGLGFGLGHVLGTRLMTPQITSTRADFSEKF